MNAHPLGVRVTVVQKNGKALLSKRIGLDAEGAIRTDGSPCRMSRGAALRVALNGKPAEVLAGIIGDLPSHRALILGDLPEGQPDLIRIDLKRHADPAAGTFARSLETFGYRPGEPAFALIDFDRKGMPPDVNRRLDEAGGFVGAIKRLVPGLDQAGTVTRASTSSGIYNAVTGERYSSSGGLHLYVLVADGADARRFLTTLHQRAWLAGYGWVTVGAAGQFLVRSIVDTAVGSPERLVFEGAPTFEPPLAQDAEARRPSYSNGLPLDTRTECPDLTKREGNAYAAAVRTAKQALAPIAADAQARCAEELAGKRGISREAATAAVQARCEGVLLPADVLDFDELGPVAVADVLSDPARFDGATLADPLEGPSYGRCKAKLFGLNINSFAHGGARYRLLHDIASAEAAVAAAGRNAASVLVGLLRRVHGLGPVERERLRDLAAATVGVGKRAVEKELKEHARKEDQQKAQRKLEKLAEGGRAVLPLPAEDDELSPTVFALDDALAAGTGPNPLVRNPSGACCRVELREPAGLHLLTSGGAAEQETAKDRLPPPAEPLITPYRLPGLRLRIEREVAFHDGDGTVKALHPAFVATFAELDGSKLPVIKGVVTAPLVLPNGRVLIGEGFDRATGLHFCIDPRLAKLVPAKASAEDARSAYRWLIGNLFPDVLTGDTGKAIAVAYMITLIERLILDCRPAFFVTANQRGGGKTTLLHMLSAAVLGRMAVAAAWSPNAEERRKSLFAALLEGVASLNWDNIPRGESVSCPHLEASLTSPVMSDRVLGVSRREQVAATTVQSFTGNNVLPAGDLASRSLVITLESTRLDPENRAFAHPDPIAWVQANRVDIVRALYTILLANPLLGAAGEGETRFKAWWRVCGHAVEHAAGGSLRFRELFLKSEDEDEEATGTADLLQSLRRAFGRGEFTSSQVAGKITNGALTEDGAILDGLVRATRKSLIVVSSNTVGQRLKMIKDRPALVDDTLLALKHASKTKSGEQGRWKVVPIGGFEEEL